MTLTVSVADFRNNISSYLGKVSRGARILVRDDKRKLTVAQVLKADTFNKATYDKALDKAIGVFSAKNHPEWKTKTSVSKWLRETRKSSDRRFE